MDLINEQPNEYDDVVGNHRQSQDQCYPDMQDQETQTQPLTGRDLSLMATEKHQACCAIF
jgi:hypothetical protein